MEDTILTKKKPVFLHFWSNYFGFPLFFYLISEEYRFWRVSIFANYMYLTEVNIQVKLKSMKKIRNGEKECQNIDKN